MRIFLENKNKDKERLRKQLLWWGFDKKNKNDKMSQG